ncbi:hypothetical protein HAX54_029474 [Datura stramonium]|uniref:Uncharacterized protein n=1 Tax=Datura stramonium TaxID=4076 RepID=A0ABS8SA73_DATST|nr:hypothetical protein [Datura stramonium]
MLVEDFLKTIVNGGRLGLMEPTEKRNDSNVAGSKRKKTHGSLTVWLLVLPVASLFSGRENSRWRGLWCCGCFLWSGRWRKWWERSRSVVKRNEGDGGDRCTGRGAEEEREIGCGWFWLLSVFTEGVGFK